MEVGELLRKSADELEESGTENALFEARLILEKAGADKLSLVCEPRKEAAEELCFKAREMIEKRKSGFPLQYILGEWEFYGLSFLVGEGVLIPRADTETLIEVCGEFIEKNGRKDIKILDLCAGSGCVGITLAKLFCAKAVLVEKSEKAFYYLQNNIEKNGVKSLCEAVLGDCFDYFGEFDIIVSNPPYLTENDMKTLQKEVSFEPREALFGGEDGLSFYRGILKNHAKNLKTGGLFAVEVGIDQARAVCEIFRENGIFPETRKDLGGIERVVFGIRN